jgi:hypothetical protein
MRRSVLAFAFAIAFNAAFAEATALASIGASAPILLEDDPAPLLGLALPEAIARYGPPATVFPVRGEEAWQDDVAFRYEPGYTLFLYGDRLWQLRFAAPYAGSVYGLFLGDEVDKACSLLGEPYERGEDFLVYRMPYRGYPVRLRLGFVDGKVSDIYVYRADF